MIPKIGQIVQIRDYSYTIHIVNGRLDRHCGCLDIRKHSQKQYDQAIVLAYCGLILPTYTNFDDFSPEQNAATDVPINNTIVRRLEDNQIIFIENTSLHPLPS